MNFNHTTELSSIDFPVERFIKAGYNTISPLTSSKRNGYSETIYYVISGELEVEVDGRVYNCKENSIIHLSKDENVVISNPSPAEKASLYYLLFELKQGFSMERLGVERVISDVNGELFKLCRDIYKTYLSEGVAHKIKLWSDFAQLLYILVTHRITSSENENVNYKLARAVQHIKMNYYKNLSVDELSSISGYSVSHFRRLFVNTYGVSPREYMLDYKVRKAKEFLAEEKDKSIEEIAELLGMCNASYFCRLFKEKAGVTPHKFKNSD